MESMRLTRVAAAPNGPERIRLRINHDPMASGIVEIRNTGDSYSIVAPLYRGSVKLEVERRVIHDGSVRPGMLRLQPPGERVRIIGRGPSKCLFVTIPGCEFDHIYRERAGIAGVASKGLIEPILKANYQVERLCGLLVSAVELDCRHRQLFIDGLAHSMLAVMMDATVAASGASAQSLCSGLTSAQMERCIDYARSSLGERLDLKVWAGCLDMTAHEFARRFQQTTRMAPYTWYMGLRIDQAKEMLLRGSLPTAEIALEVGFCSQSHFTEAFRRRVGMSPGKWKAQFRTAGS